MKKLLLIVISFGIFSNGIAQKDFTMQEAVNGLKSTLSVSKLAQLGFIPNTHSIYYIQENSKDKQLVQKNDILSQSSDVILSLSDISDALHDSSIMARDFPNVYWLDTNSLYFKIGNNYYLSNRTNNNFKVIAEPLFKLPDTAENQTVSNKGKYIAYTLKNNLWIQNDNQQSVAVTADNKPDVIYGQSVHRKEFGINGGIFFSPKENYLAFYRMDESMVADYPIIDWSTTPAESKKIKYPMSGKTSHHVTVGVYNIHTKETVYLKTGEPSEQYLTCVTWDPNERYIYIAILNRAQNHMKLNKYDVETGNYVMTLFEEKHDKYVEPQNPLYFLPESNEFIWWSQRSGYMHLYRYNTNGKLINTITKGDWLVKEINGIDNQNNTIYISAIKDDPRETHLYAVNYKNGRLAKISSKPGTHKAAISTDGKLLLDNYDNSTTPNNIELYDVNSKKRSVIFSAENPLKGFNTAQVRQVLLKSDDGTKLYGELMLPHNFDATKKYPVVVYLYNGPHVQLITNSFPESGNLWYDLMTQKGFIVFSMDGRGSANRGLDFEQSVFRQLGTLEMKDQLTGVNYLKSLPFVDTNRMGVHGWSFGGFMTTSLMTRYPDVFKVAVAGGPVIDWSMYEVMYTERYMDTPQENPEGYKKSNLLNYVNKLKGKLLMIHGAQDNVVVWQHSMKFIKACVDNKVQIDYFVYPNHPHNVRGTDRVHLMQKVTDYFTENL